MQLIDTNVLNYAVTDQDILKKRQALWLLHIALHNRDTAISPQVLRELANCLLKFPGQTPASVQNIIHRLRILPFIPEPGDVVERALDLKRQYCLQFYDAMLIATAQAANCDCILSEDLSTGQDFNGIRIQNPFMA